MIMKKKNVVKKGVREKKTHVRTAIRVIKPVKRDIETSVAEILESPAQTESEQPKKHNKKQAKPVQVTVPVMENADENNEQTL